MRRRSCRGPQHVVRRLRRLNLRTARQVVQNVRNCRSESRGLAESELSAPACNSEPLMGTGSNGLGTAASIRHLHWTEAQLPLTSQNRPRLGPRASDQIPLRDFAKGFFGERVAVLPRRAAKGGGIGSGRPTIWSSPGLMVFSFHEASRSVNGRLGAMRPRRSVSDLLTSFSEISGMAPGAAGRAATFGEDGH